MIFQKGHPFYGDLSKPNFFKKGQPSLKGMLGKKHSEEWKRQASIRMKGNIPANKGKRGLYKHTQQFKEYIKKKQLGSGNSMWKGDKVGITGLHHWVEKQLGGKPEVCSKCGKEGWIDLANIGHTYKRNLKDWIWLCRKCHMITVKKIIKLIYDH